MRVANLFSSQEMAAASLLLIRGLPLLLRLRLRHRVSAVRFLNTLTTRPSYCAASDLSNPNHDTSASAGDRPRFYRKDSPEYLHWKASESQILRDIEEITLLTKEILHSERYTDGERLSDKDEKAVAEKLLAYHPHYEDKIGCGIDCIMVDRHPQFRSSRCLFVVRTDGGWIDFSYQKCLRAYIRSKYPSHADRFIRQHFKRGSGG
ncbi:hypothetical protein Scep_001011 [Stephania cephalantha]|uniref:DCL protein n=1 Tax=Stephania cephalantha TaxID=152367 RepID=A0AAP0Q3F0_9MAGN